MRIENWPASIAFLVHCCLILAFAVLGGIFHHIPTLISAIVYGVALVAAYAALIHRTLGQNNCWGKRLFLLHLFTSVVLLAIGILAEKVIPIVGSAASYASLMVFYILNMPGLPLSKLLPYPGDPEVLWKVIRYVVFIVTTSAWLYFALLLGRAFSKERASHA